MQMLHAWSDGYIHSCQPWSTRPQAQTIHPTALRPTSLLYVAVVWPNYTVVLNSSNVILFCLQLAEMARSDGTASVASEPTAPAPTQRRNILNEIRNSRVVGQPLYEYQEPELGVAAPAAPLSQEGVDSARVRNAYAVSSGSNQTDQPREAGSSRSSIKENVDIDRVGEHTITQTGANTTLAVKYPTVHPHATAWHRLNSTMNRGGVRSLWWGAANTYIISSKVGVNSKIPLAPNVNPNAVGRAGNTIHPEALRLGPRIQFVEPIQTWNVRIDRIAQFMTGDVINSRYLASALAPLWLSSDARPELWSEVILLGGNGYDCTYVFVKLLSQAIRKAAMVRRGVIPPDAPAIVDFGWATTYVGPPANANIGELRTTCSNGALTWVYPNEPVDFYN